VWSLTTSQAQKNNGPRLPTRLLHCSDPGAKKITLSIFHVQRLTGVALTCLNFAYRLSQDQTVRHPYRAMRATYQRRSALSATPARAAVLLADMGGTTARFALLIDGVVGPVESIPAHDYASFANALSDFLVRQGDGTAVGSAELAVAGIINGERCALTNSSWIIDGAEIRAKFGFTRVHLVNDFEAIAWSLPHLRSADLFAIGGGHAIAGAPIAVLGPGTGLGVAGLVPCGTDAIVLASEGGHSTMPSASLREDAVIEHLRGQFGHISNERVLSGPGLENLYRAIATIDGVEAPHRCAAEITQAAVEGCCPISKAALDMFCAMLGTVAGNTALTFGARGGVFVAGGIVPRIADYVAKSEFRTRFETKGRLRPYLEPIPVNIVLNTNAAFIGLRCEAGRIARLMHSQ
jgi:glucokinase